MIVGMYVFGLVKLYVGYCWYKVNYVIVVGNGNLCLNLYWVGLGY